MASCRDKFNEVMTFSRKFAAICGSDIFVPNFRYTIHTWMVLFWTAGFFAVTGYTIFIGINIDNDWVVILQALCMAGSGVAGLSKLFSATGQDALYRQTYKNIDQIYLDYEQKDERYQEVLNQSTENVVRVRKYCAYVYGVATLILISVPIMFWAFFGQKIVLMQFLVPGVDPSTDIGHLITMAVHGSCVLLGSFGNYAGDMFFFIFIIQVLLMKNILRLKFEDLNEILLSAKNSQSTLVLVDILHWHQFYTTYTKTVADMYFVVVIFQISSTSISLGMTIFITFIRHWPGGYAYVMYCLIMLYVYCFMGTMTEISNDGVCDFIYNNCLWYNLNISQQRMLLIMLKKAQNPTELTVGGIMPLSVTTALSLTKTIYSCMMMLFNFLE